MKVALHARYSTGSFSLVEVRHDLEQLLKLSISEADLAKD
jgi:hypothetical protein